MTTETKHTAGPWRWEFNPSTKGVQLCGGRPQFDLTVMDYVQGAGYNREKMISQARAALEKAGAK